MDRTLYLECESGISGDMSVAMLLDLGADREVLAEALKSLPLQGYEIRISRVNRNGIDCCDFDVVLEEENHDHDMEYLYGEGEGHTHAHEHEHAHEHTHEHEHEHSHGDDHAHHHSHAHVHRHLAEINRIIDAGNLTDGANALAKKNLPHHRGGGESGPQPSFGEGGLPRGGCGGLHRGHRGFRRVLR